ncbi:MULTISPECIES: N-acetylglucosaminidase [Staphylococcus]|uniref:Autolysin n=2 Tax=Staphylococcus agnetis TaxID=985762 RepID=A0A242VHU0_9STAP|nr:MULTISPECIES: N-acetylglucosaminidase [Staphylococcus]ALN77150.1 autolysin [Staphylococcus agnetis]MBY7663449.1 N-acetylglucosaminidase [Staphylococcus agnetis]MCO4326017.1 N-acetylglucosaminidase [Staphylococcus agnetis]MCO4337833.1 N-acetylglucosaminidase [Staphylococcus agnetis]MCO4340409.1 N-acetylglucosaminidase [Staphylococcus agnetis]
MKSWIKKHPSKMLVIVILTVFMILLFINETHWFTNDKTMTFDEAVQRQTAQGVLHTVAHQNQFVEASQSEVKDAMRVEFRDHDLKYMDISEPVHLSKDEVNRMLKGKGILENQGDAFLAAQQETDVNVIYLVSHALIETGEGQSELANGIKHKGKRYYNFFGIGAFDSDAVATGKSYAVREKWTSPEKAIKGGAHFVRNQYFKNGQITLYQMKWNPQNPGTNQYASDIAWPSKIAEQMQHYYDQYGIKKDHIRRDFYKNG